MAKEKGHHLHCVSDWSPVSFAFRYYYYITIATGLDYFLEGLQGLIYGTKEAEPNQEEALFSSATIPR